MKGFGEFVKTCILGGFLGVLPVLLAVFVLMEAVNLLGAVTQPVVEMLPVEELGGVEVASLLALLLILFACFGVGVLLRTRFGSWSQGVVERAVLNRLPGYTILKSLSRRVGGLEEGEVFSAALADIHGTEAWVWAFIVEEHEGGFYTLLLPNAPTPTVGTLYYVSKERVRRLDVPVATVVNCVMQWGIGSKELLAKA
ncbi:MAG: DUF502 domain-containing protein [Myxococcota bacterium]